MRNPGLCIAIGLILSMSTMAGAMTTTAEWLGHIEDAADMMLTYQNNDGGFAWVLTDAQRAAFDGTATSPVNIQGATGRGLVRAYEATGNAAYLAAANKVAGLLNTWVTTSGSFLYNKDVEFLFELASAGGDDYTTMAQASAVGYITAKMAETGNTNPAGAVYDRYYGANWPYGNTSIDEINGLKLWMLGEWGHVGQLLGSAEITSGYSGTDFATDMAGLVETAYTGWSADPLATDVYDEWITLGYVGTLEAAYFGYGDAGTTDALSELQARLHADDIAWDWQSLGYTTYILGLLGEQDAATLGSEVLMSWQDPTEGGWVYSSGNYYPESNGEALMALSMNQPVPEPITMAGVFMGIAGLAGYIRKRRRA